MSNKAYLFRLRTAQDVVDLEKLFNCGTVPIDMEFLYKPDRAIKGFIKSDLVAAITVDRGDLRLAFYEEADVKKTAHLFFKRLDEIRYMLFQDLDNNSSVRGWVKIDADASNWVATANQHLEGAVL
jgi:hypothetical protein|tara:strand:+ start:355 stop:732 length:378 start_codon:yes stop_codon:yes gene_type:complete